MRLARAGRYARMRADALPVDAPFRFPRCYDEAAPMLAIGAPIVGWLLAVSMLLLRG